MKHALLLLLFISFFTIDISAQSSSTLQKLEKRESIQLLNFDSNIAQRSNFANQFHKQLGLHKPEDLVEKKVINGQNGWTRIRMQQRYKDLRVVGAAYILHEKDGVLKKASGDLLPYIDINTKPSNNKTSVRRSVTQYTNSKILSQAKGEAIVLPDWDIEKTELVVMDSAYPKFSGNYILAYHVIISNLKGANQYRESVYVNAYDQKIVEAISEIAHTSVEGIGQTQYYGEQTFITDSLDVDMYVLRDYTRGDGIITLNGSLDEFIDVDNIWDHFGKKVEASRDAHYCASSFHDYMSDEFSWNGLDGEGREYRSRVFGDERNVVNATWNGTYSTFYGGDCDEYGPLTTMDVVGHEFAHGFTDFTSDLIYRNESGALNESISDIFGKALEFTYDAANKDWFIGSKFLLSEDVNPFRDMADPNTRDDPKLYAGEFWEFGTRDNGGVHINSGVLNHWFYLLSEGVAGENELGVAYDVAKIGFEKATAIVFTMNTAYLTETSTYTKAVTASIESVKDLYGESSAEMTSVLEAWKAVGLYANSGDYDLRLELAEDRATVCADDLDNYPVEVYVINVGLNPYQVGDVFALSYEVEEELVTEEQVVLSEDLMPGDTMFYTYATSPSGLEADGFYDITAILEASAASDPNTEDGEIISTNNTSVGRITTTENVGLDVSVNSVTLTARSACQIEEESQIRIGIQNTGCTEIPEGDYPLVISAAGSEYNFLVTLPFDLRAGSFATLFDLIVVPEELTNGDEIDIRLSVTDDVDAENDTAFGQYLFLETIEEGYLEDFSNFDLLTDKAIFIDPDFRADAQVGTVDGNNMLIISGTNDEPFRLENCDEQEVFFRENYQKTDLEFCINTVGVEDPTLSFDMIQHRADAVIENIDPSYSVMVKVTIDSDYEVNYPIVAGQPEGERVNHEFALPDDFSDELLIEVVTLRGEGAGIATDDFSGGDFALIDNIRISSGSVSVDQLEAPSKVQVYPNPSSEIFNFSTSESQGYVLNIYDGFGRLIKQSEDDRRAITWDASLMSDGIYFYEVLFSTGEREQGKLVVKHN